MNKYEASKFLMQASIGATTKDINELTKLGKERWLEKEFSKPMNDSCEKKVDTIWNYFVKELSDMWGEDKIQGNELVQPYWFYWRMSWWDTALKTDEVLRHRVALALSEILVISDKSVLELNSYGLANYYDMLYKHAFGNYEELLYKVTMHPCMGVYLTHLNNPKEDKANNIHPDENFAREIMQLFTIGLYELNLDGTRKLDRKGNPIATYDNKDIKQLAKVFTGLGPGKYWWPWEDYSSYDTYWGAKENKIPNINLSVPMIAFEQWHEQGEKTLLKKHTIKPGQSTKQDIKETVKFLVHEQNTAVFISKKLIQSLVTSNPSKRYIKDVAKTFIDNGQGVTGDLKAVVTKILLHKEAINGVKLKEPMLRTTQILRGFGAHNDSGKLWGTGFNIEENLKQHPLSAPSVFNFFQSDYSPYGKIKEKNLVAPEFKLMDAATSIAYVNLMYEWFFGESYLLVSTIPSSTRFDAPELEWEKLNKEDLVKLDLSYEETLAKKDPNLLIEYLDLLLCAGKLRRETKKDILESIELYKDRADWIVQTAIFMITISPDFTVEG